MVKILRVDDDVHDIILEFATAEDRKLTPYLNRHFREMKKHGYLPDQAILGTNMRLGTIGLETGVPQKTEPVKTFDTITDDNYQDALKRIEWLIDINPGEGSILSRELVKLSTKVEQYELVKYPIATSEKNSEAAPQPVPVVSDLFSGEQLCCANENKPCKHWVWDAKTGEGYINILSGRAKEAE